MLQFDVEKQESEQKLQARIESALMRFREELSSEQQDHLLSIYRDAEYPHGFYPPNNVVRNLGALAWYEGRFANNFGNAHLRDSLAVATT